MSRGDRLLFYLSRKCLAELGVPRPTVGLVVGEAVVLTDVRAMKRPISIGGRRFEKECELLFERLAPLGKGLSLKASANELILLAGRPNYGQALRQTPILLHDYDAAILRRRLKAEATTFDEAADSYLEPSRGNPDSPG